MAIPFRQAVDFTQKQALNFVFQGLGGAPSNPVVGQIYFNTNNPPMGFTWSGTAWRPHDAAGLTDGSIPIAALASNPFNRSNVLYTGTQTSSTISDLAVTVQGYTLDRFASPIAPISWNGQTLTGLATAVSASGATRLDQVQALIAAAIAGQTAIKNPVRAIATSNITLSGTQTLDTIALNVGDRVAVINQTTGSQNGIYNVQSGTWTLATDANSNTSFQEGSEFLVTEGSIYAGTIWRCTNTTAITIGTTTLTFVQTAKINVYTADETTVHLTGMQFSTKLGFGVTTDSNGIAVNKNLIAQTYTGQITGNGSATSFTLTHNLGKTAIMVQIQDSAGNVDYADIQVISTTQLVVTFGTAPSNGTIYNVIAVG